MSLTPDTKPGKVSYFASKITPWTANSTAIGTSAGAVTALGTLVTTAETKLAAQVAAQSAAEAATLAATNAVNAMYEAGMNIVAQIRAQARITGDSVYELAQVQPPALPSPVGELAKPVEFTVELLDTGALKLGWKCTQPKSASGVTYNVWRQVGSGSMTCLGGTGSKEFTDNTLPRGLSQVVYQIQATRSTSVGPWASFTVVFGVDIAGSATVSSITESVPSKIAA